jgi:hypothetical protein
VKKTLYFCVSLALWLGAHVSIVSAADVGWMQKGIRVWYFGAVGSTSASDAEEAYLFGAVNGTNVQVTKHSGLNHWGTANPVDTSTYSFLDKGPCWIHPQVLQTLQSGDTWKGQVIATVLREAHTYESFKAQFSFPYLLLPIKALFDLQAQRNLVKIVYYIQGFSTGIAYFDADTGLLLLYQTSNGLVTVFFLLSEINYDFATHQAFAEDNGPHTGFKSFFLEQQMMPFPDNRGGYVLIQSSVESRYGTTVQMWVSTSEMGMGGGSYTPPFESYCFFGSVPVLRRINFSEASNHPPDEWNAYGQHLWWWVPPATLQSSTINVFGVPMTRTSTSPYTFTATQQPTGVFYFPKLWFDNDGYVTAFAAKDTTTGLDLDPERSASYYNNSTAVDGLAYFKNTMGTATPVASRGDFNADGKPDLVWQHATSGDVYLWTMNGSTQAGGGYLAQGMGSWHVVGTADFNADGKPDVVWQHATSGDVYLWTMNGTSVTGGGYLAQGMGAWKVAATGDFCGNDGKPDLVWQHETSGDTYLWCMNGTTMTSGTYLATGMASWKVVGSADFSGDGKPDLLWQHATSGDVYLWTMNGTTPTGGAYLARGMSPWTVMGPK